MILSISGCTHKTHTHTHTHTHTQKNSLAVKQLSRKLELPHATNRKTALPNFKF